MDNPLKTSSLANNFSVSRAYNLLLPFGILDRAV